MIQPHSWLPSPINKQDDYVLLQFRRPRVGFKHRGQEEERGQHFTPICPETGSGLSEPHEAGCRSREDSRAEFGAHTVSCRVCRLTILLVFPLFSRLYLAESAFVVKRRTEHSSERVSLHNAPEVLAWNNQ